MKKKIAFLFGGCSSEYDVSLKSSYNIINNIDRNRFDVVLIGVTEKGQWYLYEGDTEKILNDTWHKEVTKTVGVSLNKGDKSLLIFDNDKVTKMPIDAAFPYILGINGEDGRLPALFELVGIPVVGCGLLGSGLCMDKVRAHRLAEYAGVKVPKSCVIERYDSKEEYHKNVNEIGYPCYVKPIKAGSSYGITKVMKEDDLDKAVKDAFEYDYRVEVEENIEGFEVGCAVIGDQNMIIGEVDEISLAKESNGFFDYVEKYTPVSSNIYVPARLDKEIRDEIRRTAGIIYRALDCKGLCRIDLFYTNKGEIVFNEGNSVPGFTAHSRFPSMMKAIGMTMPEIVSSIIDSCINEEFNYKFK